MTKRKPLRTLWSAQLIGIVNLSALLVLALWMASASDGAEGTFWIVGAAVCAFFIAFILVFIVYNLDVMSSALTVVKVPLDQFMTDLGTILTEEGVRLIRRPPEDTPFYRYRWAHVFDLDGGLSMHIKVNRARLVVYIGPLVKDTREAVGRLMEMVERAG